MRRPLKTSLVSTILLATAGCGVFNSGRDVQSQPPSITEEEPQRAWYYDVPGVYDVCVSRHSGVCDSAILYIDPSVPRDIQRKIFETLREDLAEYDLRDAKSISDK